ncbi:SusC/RagA family TonB-linked outer membrane protein [Bacteroidia bacterium]|nr:SusC/RagA family TonB-linked outer membrane protein [Bacteroidia bacterium]GHT26237.1 SusC/RagA family TonB-linked outer membrane protein [Bacteroidia bacterium]
MKENKQVGKREYYSPRSNLWGSKVKMKKAFVLLLIVLGFLSFESAYSQTTIKGIVVDKEGEPLTGATVKVVNGKDKVAKGGENATYTNIDGEYSLSVLSQNYALEFSYIGYNTRVIPATNLTDLKRVVLDENSTLLDEVVITGMTKMDKRLFTGSSAHLQAGDIKIDGVAEISRSLEGRVAGVSVQNVSGTFGSAPKILIRGATSISGDSQPLWVVDGVIIDNIVEVSADQLASGDAETVLSSAVAGLNADDIETWDVLKDAAATSIYGAKAKSGVIVITTKRGKSGPSSISYTGEFSTRLIPSYSNFNIMNSQDQMSVYQEMEQKGWLNFSQTFRDRETGIYGKMYQLMNTYDPATGSFALQNTEYARNAYLREAEYRNTDWFKELFNHSIVQNHSVSISGGSDKTTYRTSASFMNDPGWYKDAGTNRYTVGLKVNHNISKNLEIELSPRVSYRKQKMPGTLGRTTNVVYGEVGREFDINPYQYALNASRALDPNETYTRNYAPFNIAHELDNNYMDQNLVDILTQGLLTWKPFKGFKASFLAAMNYQMASLEHNITDFANQAMAYRTMPDAVVRDNNSYLYKDPDLQYTLPISVLPYGGIYYRKDNKSLAYNYRASVDYSTTINDDHGVSLYASAETTSNDRDNSWFRGWGRQYSMGDIPAYAYQVFKKGQEDGTKYYEYTSGKERTEAFAASANYSYQGKYNLMVTGRYDGSNRLGKARSARWLPTWNLGAGWNLHEESFFADLRPALSHAKLFTSYGLTADRGSATNSQIIIKARTPWRPETSVQEPGLYISDLENSELTYEKKFEFNLGLELGFFNNRLNMDFQHFRRHMFDLIGRIDVMGIGGTLSKEANVAAMDSKGWEATITTKNIVTKDFKWNTSFIFSDVRSKITSLKNDQRVIDLISNTGKNFGLVGDPRRVVYSVPFAGLNEDGVPTFYNEKGEIGTYVYLQEKENIGYLKYEGSAEPTTSGSLGNLFNYKNFRLNVFITYSFGNKVRLDPVFRSYYTDFLSMPQEFKDRWILPGDENRTNIPVIISTRQSSENTGNNSLRYPYNIYNYSDVRVADGGFARMKEISLTYNVPKKLLTKASINNLSLKLQATNLFLLYSDSKLNGQDPEFNNSGGVAAPMAKQYTLTVSLGL